MKSAPLMLIAALLGTAALPAIAQAPKAPPGAPDAKRAMAGSYALDPGHSQIGFTVNHLGFSLYRGLFGDVTGIMTFDPKAPNATTLSIDIPMNRIITTSAKLDAHLMNPDFFDSAQFPTAHFSSTTVRAKGTKAMITGNLTIKGITKPVVLSAHFVGAGKGPMNGKETLGFEATTTIKRSDFGVSYGVPMVSDDVPLTISVAFEKAN